MKIIAGSAGGLKLEVAAGSTARPFLEMARGALFNSLGGAVPEARALDLYAGSGALGLEALSRGAASCVFVERDRRSVAALQKNIERCRMEDRARVCQSDVASVLAAETERFDLIFADPPFPDLGDWRSDGRAGTIMRDMARLLSAGGVLVFRIEEGRIAPPDWPDLVLLKDKRYGRSRVCRYGHSGDTSRIGEEQLP